MKINIYMSDTVKISINDSFGIKSMKFIINDYPDKIKIDFTFLENIHNSNKYYDLQNL